MAVLLSRFFTGFLMVGWVEFVSAPGMCGVVCLEKHLMILTCFVLFESGCM